MNAPQRLTFPALAGIYNYNYELLTGSAHLPDFGERTSGQIQGRHFAVEEDVVGTGFRTGVPEAYALVEMAADYRGAGAVHDGEVVAAGTGELCFYTWKENEDFHFHFSRARRKPFAL